VWVWGVVVVVGGGCQRGKAACVSSQHWVCRMWALVLRQVASRFNPEIRANTGGGEWQRKFHQGQLWHTED
jgi:hypothetical protein